MFRVVFSLEPFQGPAIPDKPKKMCSPGGPLKKFDDAISFQVKMSGPLPRLSEDANRVNTLNVFTPFNPWAPKRALFGQNDYIDILGDDPDAIKPHQQHYHIPR